jgi:CMP-N-acetylneuraminic acid synthetase
MIHAVEHMESARNYRYDIVVLMQPTCPVRNPEHIDQAVKLLWESELDTCASVKGPYKKRDPCVKAIREGVLQSYRPDEGDTMEAYYTYNASIYAVKRRYLFDNELFVSRYQVPLVMDRLHSLDIDDEYDLVAAEALIERFDNQAGS